MPLGYGNLALVFDLPGILAANVHHIGNIDAKHLGRKAFKVEAG